MRASLVFGHNPGPFTGAGSNSWLIHGRVATLIDAGSGLPQHLSDLTSVLDAAGTPLAQVLVTHAHPDHAGGAEAVAGRWPDARFAKYPWTGEDGRFPVVWHPLQDEDLVEAGDGHLWVVHTPGHSPDHVCFFEPRSGTLFAGDLVMTGGTVVIPPSRGGSLSQYLKSLERVLDLQPRRILPGHGPVIDQPASLLRGYLAHRQARERQILDALAAGPLTIPAIVERVYPGLAAALTWAAGESMLAHLLKLGEEARVLLDDSPDPLVGRWRLS